MALLYNDSILFIIAIDIHFTSLALFKKIESTRLVLFNLHKDIALIIFLGHSSRPLHKKRSNIRKLLMEKGGSFSTFHVCIFI